MKQALGQTGMPRLDDASQIEVEELKKKPGGLKMMVKNTKNE